MESALNFGRGVCCSTNVKVKMDHAFNFAAKEKPTSLLAKFNRIIFVQERVDNFKNNLRFSLLAVGNICPPRLNAATVNVYRLRAPCQFHTETNYGSEPLNSAAAIGENPSIR
jgi:hypothetical protein